MGAEHWGRSPTGVCPGSNVEELRRVAVSLNYPDQNSELGTCSGGQDPFPKLCIWPGQMTMWVFAPGLMWLPGTRPQDQPMGRPLAVADLSVPRELLKTSLEQMH